MPKLIDVLDTINEEITLRPKNTGLPLIIFIDHDKTHANHANRIKVQNGRSGSTNVQETGVPYTIEDNPHIPNSDKHIVSNISSKDEKLIIAFIKANKELLIKLDNQEIDPDTFKKLMITDNN